MMNKENMMLKVREVDGKILGQDGEIIEDDFTEYSKKTDETNAIAEEAKNKIIKMLGLKLKGKVKTSIFDGESYRSQVKIDAKLFLFPKIDMMFSFGQRIVHSEGTGMKWWDKAEHDIWASVWLCVDGPSSYIDESREFEYDLKNKEWVELATGMEDGTFNRRENDK